MPYFRRNRPGFRIRKYASRRGPPSWGTMLRPYLPTLGKRKASYSRGSNKRRRTGGARVVRRGNPMFGKAHWSIRRRTKSYAVKALKQVNAKDKMMGTGGYVLSSSQNQQAWHATTYRGYGNQNLTTGPSGSSPIMTVREMISTIYGTTAVGNHYWLRDYRVREVFCNSGNTIATLKIYDLIARKDQSISEVWQPEIALANIATVQNAQAIVPADLTFNPFMNPFFCQRWKVCGVKEISLNPGQIYKRTISYGGVERVSPGTMLGDAGNSQDEIVKAGKTFATLYSVRGQPAHLESSGITGAIAVLSRAQVTKYYEVRGTLQRSEDNFTSISEGFTKLAPAGAAALIVNDDSGEIVTAAYVQ